MYVRAEMSRYDEAFVSGMNSGYRYELVQWDNNDAAGELVGTAFASDLGLPVGLWPARLEIPIKSGLLKLVRCPQLSTEDAVVYLDGLGSTVLTVFNT